MRRVQTTCTFGPCQPASRELAPSLMLQNKTSIRILYFLPFGRPFASLSELPELPLIETFDP